MKEIPLTQGKVALVDDGDFDALNAYKWRAMQVETGDYYAVRSGSIKGGQPPRTILMHRQIIGAADGVDVDHKNTNTLDNQSHNLRPATKSQNAANRHRQRNSTSQYRGVNWHKARGKWMARIKVNGHQTYLGVFGSEQDAARAYDAAAKLHQGEFAYLNFPQAVPA